MASRPVRLVVGDVTVNRSGKRKYPGFTVIYEKGARKSGPFHLFDRRMSLQGMSSDSVTFYCSGFTRSGGVRDEVVTCTWSYSEGGVTLNATSQVNVLGQPDRLEVNNGTVTRSPRHGRFAPIFTVHFTDGSKKSGYRHVFGREENRPKLCSISPETIERRLSHLARKGGVPDSEVTCTWSYTEGEVTVQATSHVQVLGQPESLAVSDGKVKPGKKFYPYFVVKFTDGSQAKGYFHVIAKETLFLLSTNPDILSFHNSGFESKPGPPEEFAVCQWMYNEGPISVYTTSVVQIEVPDSSKMCLSEPLDVSEESIGDFGKNPIPLSREYLKPAAATEKQDVTFSAGQPAGLPIDVRVESIPPELTENLDNSQIRDITFDIEKNVLKKISIPLFPQVLNRITFQVKGTPPESTLQRIHFIEQKGPRQSKILEALPFKMEKKERRVDVTEEEMREFVRRVIAEARKFSLRLADYLERKEGEDKFWDLWNNRDNKTDEGTGLIKISRGQVREGLKIIKNLSGQQKAKAEKNFMERWVGLILHEAGHRKAVKNGTAVKPQHLEEVRNSDELINTMIDLLERINQWLCGGTPDPNGDGKGFDYLRNDREKLMNLGWKIRRMIFRELRYRMEHAKAKYYKEFWAPLLNLKNRWKRDVVRKIERIKGNPNIPNWQEKVRQARQVITDFKEREENRKALEIIERYSGLEVLFLLDERCLQPWWCWLPSRKFQGRKIPVPGVCR